MIAWLARKIFIWEANKGLEAKENTLIFYFVTSDSKFRVLSELYFSSQKFRSKNLAVLCPKCRFPDTDIELGT